MPNTIPMSVVAVSCKGSRVSGFHADSNMLDAE